MNQRMEHAKPPIRLARHHENDSDEICRGKCSPRKLVQLLDNELNQETERDVFGHLFQCDACRYAIYHIMRNEPFSLYVNITE